MRPIERKKIAENEAAAEAAMEAAEAAQTDVDEIKSPTSTVQYIFLSDGTTKIRQGIRATKFVVDKTLTETGFAGVEDTDWANMVSLPQA